MMAEIPTRRRYLCLLLAKMPSDGEHGLGSGLGGGLAITSALNCGLPSKIKEQGTRHRETPRATAE
jgi:hypothetical protein